MTKQDRVQQQGTLIVVEGSDGSGKKTQTDLLYERLIKEGYRVKKVDFPNYHTKGSVLVEAYLNGEFGKNAEDVNPYTASSFYAVDRVYSFLTDWKEFYESGGIILADRYTTSNMVHQAAKMDEVEEKIAFIEWLHDHEYNKLQLPEPDIVFFLDVPPHISSKLREGRANKITNGEKQDIHESDQAFMKKSYENAKLVADYEGWVRVNCINEEEVNILSIEKIHQQIYKRALPFIKSL